VRTAKALENGRRTLDRLVEQYDIDAGPVSAQA
jgi:hypothetical protein